MNNTDKSMYLDRLETITTLFMKYADMRRKNDVQHHVEENYEKLGQRRASEFEILYGFKAFTTRTEDLDTENKLLQEIYCEWDYAVKLVEQDATLEEVLDLMVPAFPNTKWVLEDISAIDYYVNHVEPKVKEVKNVATIRKLCKHAKKTKKGLKKVLTQIEKLRLNLDDWEPETFIAIYANAVGNK